MVVSIASPASFGFLGFAKSVLRSSILYGLVFLAWEAANRHVDNTQWASDIIAERRYGDAFETEFLYSPDLSHLPSTLPHRNDVLIETRYGSKHLHMYNDFAKSHPGSQFFFDELVAHYKSAFVAVESENVPKCYC